MKALEQLRKRNWTQSEIYDEDTGTVCLNGALIAGMSERLLLAGEYPSTVFFEMTSGRLPLEEEALMDEMLKELWAITDVLISLKPADDPDIEKWAEARENICYPSVAFAEGLVIEFNDKRAACVEDVYCVLEKAAAELGTLGVEPSNG